MTTPPPQPDTSRPARPVPGALPGHPFLARLDAEAQAREAEEAEFRATMKAQVAGFAERRAFAFRRANLVRSLLDTVARAPDRETAVASAQAMLRSRLGWREDSPARDEVVSAYAAVAAAAFEAARRVAPDTAPPDRSAPISDMAGSGAGVAEPSPDDLGAALSAFEAWYAATRDKPFWVLFEHYMPETQLVDF